MLQAGQLVVLESTTYPGTTRERLVPLLEESGLAAGRDFNVAFSPERIDPGRTDFTLRTTPKVVGGLTAECRAARGRALRERLRRGRARSPRPEAAELTKLLENVFRSVNIALVNELAMLCDRMGIDVWEVVDAAATKPYGFMSFKPGPGMGGHCLPVDPFYLAWRAREFDQPTEFIELAGEVNQRMPYFCVEKIGRALNDHAKPIKGSRVAIVGVSYKPGVGDLRESPALKILALLAEGTRLAAAGRSRSARSRPAGSASGCPRRARGDQLAANHEALLVGERHVHALAERDDRGSQTGGSDNRVEHEIRIGRRDQVAHAGLTHVHLRAVELRGCALGGRRIGQRDRAETPASRAWAARRSSWWPRSARQSQAPRIP